MLDKVYISYFYQIRFFTPEYIPLSTAIYDPKWFHNNRGQDNIFSDKNDVINGLRIESLHPYKDNDYCVHCNRTGNPDTCGFMKNYREQLADIDFEDFIEKLEEFLININQKILKMDKDLIPVFIVHEAPDNKCSERVPLIEWFNSNDVECIEWSKDLVI